MQIKAMTDEERSEWIKRTTWANTRLGNVLRTMEGTWNGIDTMGGMAPHAEGFENYMAAAILSLKSAKCELKAMIEGVKRGE